MSEELYNNEIDTLFSPNGIIAHSLGEKYNWREGQVEASKLIFKGINDNKHVILEAGTGIGKSFAYLIPIFLLLSSNPHSAVVIATSTNTLLDQLYKKDIPFLTNNLGLKLEVTTLYGRGNYVCRRKWEDYVSNKLMFEEDNSPLKKINAWYRETKTGSLLEINEKEGLLYLDNARSDQDDCFGRSCPFKDNCFFFKARAKAKSSRLVITNHHVVLYDASSRAESNEGFNTDYILPPYSYLVLDEAHHLESEAMKIFSSEFSYSNVSFPIEILTRKEKAYMGFSLLEHISSFQDKKQKPFDVRLVIRALLEEKKAIEEYQEEINKSVNQYLILNGYKNTDTIQEIFLDFNFLSINPTLREKGEEIAKVLRKTCHTIQDSFSSLKDSSQVQVALNYASSLGHAADTLTSIIRFNENSNKILYASRNIKNNSFVLHLSPTEIASYLKKALFTAPFMKSITMLSATLSTNNNFSFFKEALGLVEFDVLEGIFKSPFNYSKQLYLMIPTDGENYVVKGEGQKKYLDYLVKTITTAIEASSGGALVLFTSNNMRDEVYERVNMKLKKHFKLLKQSKTISKAKLLEEFIRDKDSSLFASDTYWEGIDAPGDTCRLVIITKLPFIVPSDPIYIGKERMLQKEGKNAFVHISLPNAVLRLKQGLGRLIRNEEDRGVVLILDRRLYTKRTYSNIILSSIEHGELDSEITKDNLGRKIERFFEG